MAAHQAGLADWLCRGPVRCAVQIAGIAEMSGPIVIVGPDGHGYVPIGEHERVRRKKALMTECLMTIAQAMNKLADGLDKENSSLDDETRPAPLGD